MMLRLNGSLGKLEQPFLESQNEYKKPPKPIAGDTCVTPYCQLIPAFNSRDH